MSDHSLNTSLGRYTEQLVKEKLLKKGYLFLEANYLLKTGEIDLIFIDPLKPRKTIVFVEVRSATKENKLLKYSVSFQKRQRLYKTIALYISKNKKYYPNGVSYRFDMVWVTGEKIEHWTNVEI